VPRGQNDESLLPYSRLSRPESLLFVYSKNNGSVVSQVILTNIVLPEDGRTTETCSSLSNNKQ
jgi:hypothetical protein